MKTKTMYAFTVCSLLICSLACKNDQEVSQNDKEIPQQIAAVTPITSDCDFSQPMLVSYKIANTKALADIARYDAYYEDLKNSLPIEDTDHLIKGVSVATEELYQLVCAMRSQPGDSLYIMNAIKRVNTDSGFTTMTDVIFVVEHNPELGAPITSIPNSFYDFTQPCPAACPTLTGNNITE